MAEQGPSRGPCQDPAGHSHQDWLDGDQCPEMVREEKQLLDLADLSAAYMEKVACHSIWQWASAKIARAKTMADLQSGTWWQPMQHVQRKGIPGLSYLRRLWAGSEHGQADLHQCKRAVYPLLLMLWCHWHCVPQALAMPRLPAL